MRAVLLLGAFNFCLCAAQTTVLYNPAAPTVGPFPTNALTVADANQKTGIRVNLPSSFQTCDVETSPSVCSNTGLLNQLDGFSVNARVMTCFSGPIDPTTLQAGIQLIALAGTQAVSINQIIFDPASNCAFAKPNQVLNQQSQYLLVVTDSVHDGAGKKVREDSAFKQCLKSSDPYCEALERALQQVQQQPASTNKVVAASLFTTMSATTWLEQARRLVDARLPPVVLPAGVPSSFSVSAIQSITWIPQGSGDDTGNSEVIARDVLSGVGQIGFGMYLSPIFLDPSNGSIAVTPTARPISAPAAYIPVSFHLFLPSGPKPRTGYPVVIYGHGLGDNQFGAPTYIASTFAQNGIATLAFEITGHGYGPGGIVQVIDAKGTHTLVAPGRGVQLSPGSPIGPTDGCILPGALGVRDCGRQTAVDLFALVQIIRATGGLGFGLDPSRVFYVGQSFGGTYGTLFQAVEPNVQPAVLNGDGGTSVDIARLAITGRPLGVEYLASVNTSLLNVDSGIAPPEPYFNDDFNDNYVFRDMPPVTNTVAGAMAIQAAFEAAEWVGMLGDPLSYAPHLTTLPLTGVPAKSTLFQFGYGDLEVPNPTESAVIRAANAQSTAWFFRFDEAVEIDPSLLAITMPAVAPLPILPHRVLSNPTIFTYSNETSLALAEQQQAASYFVSGGSSNPDPNPSLTGEFAGDTLFQIPATLPTQLNFIQP
jgi:dienelactone hydrolase